MTKATFNLHPQHHVGSVDPRIFGGFLEHMGRAVYQGVFDPSSIHADEFGCRTDVLDALSELEFTVMRYPGEISFPIITGEMAWAQSLNVPPVGSWRGEQ